MGLADPAVLRTCGLPDLNGFSVSRTFGQLVRPQHFGSLKSINGFSRVSGKFLVGINPHEQDRELITSVTNIRTHCTDKLCDSPTKY